MLPWLGPAIPEGRLALADAGRAAAPPKANSYHLITITSPTFTPSPLPHLHLTYPSDNLKREPHLFEFRRLLPLKFCPNLLKSPDCLLGVESFPAMKTDLRMNLHRGRVITSPQELLHILLDQLTAAHRASLKRHHFPLLLSRQLTHRSGSRPVDRYQFGTTQRTQTESQRNQRVNVGMAEAAGGVVYSAPPTGNNHR